MNLSNVELNEFLEQLEYLVSEAGSTTDVDVQNVAKSAWWKLSLLKSFQTDNKSNNPFSIDKSLLLDYIAYLDTEERKLGYKKPADIYHLDVWLTKYEILSGPHCPDTKTPYLRWIAAGVL
ncbi:MAG: hypothetical protein IPN69_04425 [Acidobacteria bacterium]|nr:hypothetical protein [Acidobacteriota bacterium]